MSGCPRGGHSARNSVFGAVVAIFVIGSHQSTQNLYEIRTKTQIWISANQKENLTTKLENTHTMCRVIIGAGDRSANLEGAS